MKTTKNYKEAVERIYHNNGEVIIASDVREAGIPSPYLYRFIEQEGLHKLGEGIYASNSAGVGEGWLIQKRYPGYVFSGLSALFFLQMGDRIPDFHYVRCQRGYHPSKNKPSLLKCSTESNRDYFQLGNTVINDMFGRPVVCYGPEKMMVEMVRNRDHEDTEIFKKFLNSFSLLDNVDMKLLYKLARLKHVEKKVFEIMEILDKRI